MLKKVAIYGMTQIPSPGLKAPLQQRLNVCVLNVTLLSDNMYSLF